MLSPELVNEAASENHSMRTPYFKSTCRGVLDEVIKIECGDAFCIESGRKIKTYFIKLWTFRCGLANLIRILLDFL